ncbi:MAG: hypothetical protein JO347_06345 [Candidatus Eremiobacteraeota bacterium]|nr:hypothetical protein [Candidatus Eremiobacteraeota bacterium]
MFSHLFPTPKPSPIISVVPPSLTFTAANKGPSTITASENNGNTSFSATTTDATIANVTPQGGTTNVFNVTATGKTGACKIQVSDGAGQTFNVQVTTN